MKGNLMTARMNEMIRTQAKTINLPFAFHDVKMSDKFCQVSSCNNAFLPENKLNQSKPPCRLVFSPSPH